jgi:hypothetical protein
MKYILLVFYLFLLDPLAANTKYVSPSGNNAASGNVGAIYIQYQTHLKFPISKSHLWADKTENGKLRRHRYFTPLCFEHKMLRV